MTLARIPSDRVEPLADERVRLRQITASDAADIEEITFYDGVPAKSVNDVIKMLALIEKDRARGEALHWGISLAASPTVVGTCGFYRGFAAQVGEVGYVLREDYRGKGIMTAALRLVVAYGFDELGLTSVVAYTEPDNAASIAVLDRVGFVEVTEKESDSANRKFSLARP